jgi:cytochrome c-type biogenesis protein CcmH/NrfG
MKVYNKIIEKQPNFINAYVGIALTYEYRRIQKPKAIEMANKILAKDPENMYAYFILARNQQDIQQKIQKLKEAS